MNVGITWIVIIIVKILAENPRNGGKPPRDRTFSVNVSLVSRELLGLKISETSSRDNAEKNNMRGMEIMQ